MSETDLYAHYSSSTEQPAGKRVNATTLDRLHGYNLAWQTYHQRVSYRILQGQYYRQKLQGKATSSDSEKSDSGTDEVLGHVEKAQSIAISGAKEQLSPQSLLVSAAADSAGVGPLEDLYSTVETAETIYRVTEQLNTAQREAFDQIQAQIEGKADATQRVAGNPGFLEAGRAFAYYRYVEQHGPPGERQQARTYLKRLKEGPQIITSQPNEMAGRVAIIAVEWRKGGGFHCQGNQCKYTGSVQYNNGGAVRYLGDGGGDIVDSGRLSKYKRHIYFTSNVAKWQSGLSAYIAYDDPKAFLSGGTKRVSVFDKEEKIKVKSRTISEGPPPLPANAQLAQTTLTDEEYTKLQRMIKIARSHRTSVNRTRRRLATVYDRLYWPRKGRLSAKREAMAHVTGEWRYYHRLVDRTSRVFNADAYNKTTGTYVDTPARIRALRTLLTEFESADEFGRHLDQQRTEIRGQIRQIERWPPGPNISPVMESSIAIQRVMAFAGNTIWGKLLLGFDAIVGLIVLSTVVTTVTQIRE